MRPHRRPESNVQRPRGFTLVEVVVVIVMLAVLSVSAIPAVNSIAASRGGAAAWLVAADLGYARERALQTGVRTWVEFDVGSVSVLSEQRTSPGRGGARLLDDPGGSGSMVDVLGGGAFAGVSISGVSFDGGEVVGFDSLGRPLNQSESLLSADGTVTLSGGPVVRVMSGSGLVVFP